MGRKGWGGAPPADDAEARKRIVDAATRCVARRGSVQATVTDVADDLGVTRRTVYRYFASVEELLAAVVETALGSFIDEIASATADMDDLVEHLVEIVAHIIERLPGEPLLALLLSNDRTNVFSRRMLLPEEIVRCRAILQHTRIDWAGLGYDDRALDELVEFLLRMIQSMVIAPLEPPRDGVQLRAYLRRWVGPALIPPCT
jgi:AcrR family transcriptional regulator